MQKLIQALIKWTPSGVSFGITAHALLNQDWIQAVILSFLTGCSSLWVKFSSKFIEEAEKEAERRGENFAQWFFRTFDTLISEVCLGISKFWKITTSQFKPKYYKRLFYICRDFQTQGLDKDRVLNLRKVFVPLKIIAKESVRISPNIIQTGLVLDSKNEGREIGDFLVAMEHESAFRRILISGAPGSGKTTLLRHLALLYVTNSQRTLHHKIPKLIPVLLYLKDEYQEIVKEPAPSLDSLITKRVEQLQPSSPLKAPNGWFLDKLRRNKCLVMLDGLDEIADEKQRQKVSCWIDCQMQSYPNTAFILTSRPFGYKSIQFEQSLTVLEVRRFSWKQIREFTHNWYLQTEIISRAGEEDSGVREEAKFQANDLLDRIWNRLSLSELAANPLLLTMIATVHRRGSALPGRRVELYKEICHVLLEKRQAAKRIPDLLSAAQKQFVLQSLALWMMENRTRTFTLPQVESIIGSRLHTMPINQMKPENFIKQIKDVSGLIIDGKLEGFYDFAHLSFQEYLASVEIKESKKENILIDVIQELEQISWWAETIRLYSAQNNSTALVAAFMKNPTLINLTLAYDCLEEGFQIDADVRKTLERKLEIDLESADAEVAELAAKVHLLKRFKDASKN